MGHEAMPEQARTYLNHFLNPKMEDLESLRERALGVPLLSTPAFAALIRLKLYSLEGLSQDLTKVQTNEFGKFYTAFVLHHLNWKHFQNFNINEESGRIPNSSTTDYYYAYHSQYEKIHLEFTFPYPTSYPSRIRVHPFEGDSLCHLYELTIDQSKSKIIEVTRNAIQYQRGEVAWYINSQPLPEDVFIA